MINCRSALRAKFTIAAVVISLFAFMFAVTGCEIQDLGITESAPPAAPPQSEASLSVSSQSSVPANPPAWSATTLYNRAGMYVTHKGKVWVSQWYITLGAEPGANSWNGWKIAEVPSADKNNPKPWSADITYNAKGYYVTHKGSVWVSQWSITRGAEPGANTWNGWKQVTPPPKWTDVSISASYSFAINEKGELYGWGSNAQGRLGDGTTTDRRTPSRIGTAADWKDVSTRRLHTLVINEKGELYTWGDNGYGELGNGTSGLNIVIIDNDNTNQQSIITRRDTPTRIGTASDWVQISAGLNHGVAVNSKGELYAWGHNNYGRLGDGTVIDRNSPTRIGTAADWKNVSGRGSHNLAINTKGEIYAWGRNNDGQVGDGTTIDHHR